MGNHYIPQFYLKGFLIPNSKNKIIRYECDLEKCFVSNIKNIGQETNFYPAETEKYLAESIEEPANSVIRKIALRQELTINDKQIFTDYLVVILKRVPAFLVFVKSKFPDVIEIIRKKVKEHYNQLLASGEIDKQHQNEIFQKIDDFDVPKIFNDERMREVWLEFISPGMTPLISKILINKQWIFFISKDKQYYITCDNPFFYFDSLGLQDSEFSFPISKDIALIAVNCKDELPNYVTARTQIVKEINRRSIENATNYIFSPKDEEWILEIIRKRGNIHLSRLNIFG